MSVSRILIALVLLLGVSFGFARIGQPADLEELEEQGLLNLAAAEQFEVEVVRAGELLYRFSGEAAATAENFDRLGAVVGYATGFGEQIAVPVSDFLETNLEGILQAGTAVVPIEGNYLLELALSSDETDTVMIDWNFGLLERQADAFVPARHGLGAPAESARVVIREYADFQCPHCARFSVEAMPVIEELLAEDDGLRFEFHHLPLVSIHANALPAAEAAECIAAAGDGSGTFFEISTLIFDRMQAWAQLPDPGPYFVRLAQENGFDTTGVAECLEEREQLAYIQQSALHAAEDLAIQGTPTVFVDGFQVGAWNQRGSYEALIELVDARRTEP